MACQNSLLRRFLKHHANLAGSEPGDTGVEQLMTEDLLWVGAGGAEPVLAAWTSAAGEAGSKRSWSEEDAWASPLVS